MGIWRKHSQEEIKERVFGALEKNVDFRKGKFLGVPASHLDSKVFYNDAPFLKEAPYMSTMVANPNHIGCHTLGESEKFFAGTQELEKELIRICAEDILKAEEGFTDGYVASGGTEANVQAAWIYRNEFQHENRSGSIAILCSADTHYAVYKAANLLSLEVFPVLVDEQTRALDVEDLTYTIQAMTSKGVERAIVFVNMGTTMFGSVDQCNVYAEALQKAGVEFRIHIDGAYGGFIYPFTALNDLLTFQNPDVSSVTLDAHKLAQAPYGTGIFIARKGLMQHVFTEQASYVSGQDITLVGSRSGANAVATWMILSTYGPHQWKEKIQLLMYRTDILVKGLQEHGISFYRHPQMNIVTMPSHQVSDQMAEKYHLVPDNHHNPKWRKIVVMDHVTSDLIHEFLNELK